MKRREFMRNAALAGGIDHFSSRFCFWSESWG